MTLTLALEPFILENAMCCVINLEMSLHFVLFFVVTYQLTHRNLVRFMSKHERNRLFCYCSHSIARLRVVKFGDTRKNDKNLLKNL